MVVLVEDLVAVLIMDLLQLLDLVQLVKVIMVVKEQVP